MSSVAVARTATSPGPKGRGGRIMRALTLGRPQDGADKARKAKAGKGNETDQGVAEQVVPPPRVDVVRELPQEDSGSEPGTSPVQEKTAVPSSLHVENIQFPSPGTSPTEITASPVAASPTFFRRITTRMRKLSRPSKLEAGLGPVVEDDPPPPVPSLPALKTVAPPPPPPPSVPAPPETAAPSVERKGTVSRAEKPKRTSLFFSLSSKSTPTLVKEDEFGVLPVQNDDVPPAPKRASLFFSLSSKSSPSLVKDDTSPIPPVDIPVVPKRASLLMRLSSKSTPTLVKPDMAIVEEAEPDFGAVTKHSSTPKLDLVIPSLPSFSSSKPDSIVSENQSAQPAQPDGKDPTPVPVSSSGLLAALAGPAQPAQPAQADGNDPTPVSGSGSGSGQSAVPAVRSKVSFTDQDAARVPLPASPSVSASGLTKSGSKFFVGSEEEADAEEEARTRRRAATTGSMALPRSASMNLPAAAESSPTSAGPPSRPTTGNAANRKSRPISMFSGWRKSSYDPSSSPSGSPRRTRQASADTTSSSTDSHAVRMAVSPVIHSTGGFVDKEERIKDPESRRLTENAFM